MLQRLPPKDKRHYRSPPVIGSPNLIYILMDDRFPRVPGGGYSRFTISKTTVTIAATVTWKLKNKSIIS